MIEADKTGAIQSSHSFWLHLGLDIVVAALIFGIFFFPRLLPQLHRQLKREEVSTADSDAVTAPEGHTTEREGEAESEEAAQASGSGQAAVIVPANPAEAGRESVSVSEPAELSLREKFSDFFTDETEKHKKSYTSPNLSVQITEETDEAHSTKPFYIHIADIHVAEVESLQAGFPAGQSAAAVDEIAIENRAVLAVNGDYYLNSYRGIVVRNGVLLQSEKGTTDICVLYEDGVMETYGPDEYSKEELLGREPWQIWSFGPALLDRDGRAKKDFNTSAVVSARNPRTAIGYYEPGHYCLVVIDGRQKGGSAGADIQTLAAVMENLGCRTAYNLDGGDSSVMVFGREIVNKPSGWRSTSDTVQICEPPTAEIVIEGG